MPHNLASINGKVCFAYHDRADARPVWHGLGTSCEDALTPDEALKLVQADLPITEEPLLVAGAVEGSLMRVGGRKALVRHERGLEGEERRVVLGDVGEDYQLVQYGEAMDVFRTLFPERRCVDTAGLLGAGEVFFASVALDEAPVGSKGDSVKRYLVLHAGHDGKTPVRVLMCDVRPVCQNTVSLGLKTASNKITVKHRAGARESLAVATKILAANERHRRMLLEAFNVMAGRECGAERVKAIIGCLFPDPKRGEDEAAVSSRAKAPAIRERVTALFEGEADGADMAGRTDWALYQSVTEWAQREQVMRGERETPEGDRKMNRWLRSVFSPAAEELRERAFTLLMDPSIG